MGLSCIMHKWSAHQPWAPAGGGLLQTVVVTPGEPRQRAVEENHDWDWKLMRKTMVATTDSHTCAGTDGGGNHQEHIYHQDG